MLVQERVSVRGHVAGGVVHTEEAGGNGGSGGGNGGIGLRVRLVQVRVHEVHQRVKSRVQQVGRVQRGDVDGGNGDKRRLGLDWQWLELRLRRTQRADDGLLWSLCVLGRGRLLLLLLGNQPWSMRRGKKNNSDTTENGE